MPSPSLSGALSNIKDTANSIVSEGGRQLRATFLPSQQETLPAEQRAMNQGSPGPAPPPPRTPAPPANWYADYRNRAANVLGSFKRGGLVKRTGAYQLHRGERVVALAKAISKHKRKAG